MNGLSWSCEVCCRPLDVKTYVEDDGSHTPIFAAHASGDTDDHVPAPIRRAPAVLICDLCSGPDPGWVVPVKNIERTNVFASHAGPAYDVDALWAACAECARLTDAGDLTGIVRRYRRSGSPQAPVRLLRRHFEAFLDSVIGPTRPI